MQILRILPISLLLAIVLISAPVYGKINTFNISYSETPARTIVIKHPAANNPATFFSTSTVLTFEVFKPGSKEDVAAIIKALTKDGNVQSCTAGVLTGDYQAFTLTLKSAKDKAWFASLFKKAGLNTIKINNNPIVEVDKM